VLMVADVRQTLAWYRDVLGFHIDFEYGDPPTHARVSSGDREHAGAARIRFEKGPESVNATSGCYLYLHIGEGMDELCEEFRARDVEISAAPTDRPWGRQFSIRDLNGYTLSFLAAG
jgi:catechol 2,3-dioxygenase-like lactoylglutathione lyase family enzyme